MSEYDEFGNLIDSEESETEHDLIPPNPDEESDVEESNQLIVGGNAQSLSINQRFGNNVTTITPEQQIQDTSEPVIKPRIHRIVKVEDDDLPPLRYSRDYMVNTGLSVPSRVRNIAFTGNLNSGKTMLIDKFIQETHELTEETPKYLDNHILELKRGITIKSSPITLLLSGSNGVSQMMNIIDTPGHINFDDEVQVSLQAVETVVVVIDVVEGLTFRDKLILDDIIKMKKNLVVVFNKLDRLIMELRLPVVDAYYKLHSIYDDINDYIANHELNMDFPNVKPQSIVFASSYGITFTLKDFARLYVKNYQWPIDEDLLASKLWDDYFNPDSNKFTKLKKDFRSFVYFILEPVYKLFTYTLTQNKQLKTLLWENFGVEIPKKVYELDSKNLLVEVMQRIFNLEGFIDVLVEQSNPVDESEILDARIIKLIDSSDGDEFYSLVRVFSGSLSVGDEVDVTEDETKKVKIEEMFISGGRYKFTINTSGPGFLVLVKGIEVINKQGLITLGTEPKSKLMDLTKKSVFKVSIQPKNPKELPILLEILKKVTKSYLSSVVKIEDSGDLTILGTGELMMDCLLHDLRNFYGNNSEIRVSDPMVKFGETVSESSITKIPTSSVGGDCKISVIAETSSQAISNVLQKNDLKDRKTIKQLMTTGMDVLEARSIWAFTPDDQPSLLIDDTIEKDPKLQELRSSLETGFQWSCQEGPLVGEIIRNTKFKILDVVTNGNIQRSKTIPMMRKACYAGFLTAGPRLMEPIYEFHITTSYKARNAIKNIIDNRRGQFISTEEIPGTNLLTLTGNVPVIESMGLETDIRLKTSGQAMIYLHYSNYDIVPGNPLDKDVYLPELKAVPEESLARDFMIKTRNRKGIPGEANLQRYIDNDIFEKLKSVGLI